MPSLHLLSGFWNRQTACWLFAIRKAKLHISMKRCQAVRPIVSIYPPQCAWHIEGLFWTIYKQFWMIWSPHRKHRARKWSAYPRRSLKLASIFPSSGSSAFPQEWTVSSSLQVAVTAMANRTLPHRFIWCRVRMKIWQNYPKFSGEKMLPKVCWHNTAVAHSNFKMTFLPKCRKGSRTIT